MGKHARLAHLHDFSHRTDAQALQPHMGGQTQRSIDDGGAGLLSFGLPACPDPPGLTRGGGGAAAFRQLGDRVGGVEHGRDDNKQNKTNGRAILQVNIGHGGAIKGFF